MKEAIELREPFPHYYTQPMEVSISTFNVDSLLIKSLCETKNVPLNLLKKLPFSIAFSDP